MAENGRVALVSGGNRGIGLEIVRQLAERSITTILGSRDEESGRKAAEELSGNVVVQGLDVPDFSRERIDKSVLELQEERDAVSQLGLV